MGFFIGLGEITDYISQCNIRVYIVMLLKMKVLWKVTLCFWASSSWSFLGTTFSRNVGKFSIKAQRHIM